MNDQMHYSNDRNRPIFRIRGTVLLLQLAFWMVYIIIELAALAQTRAITGPVYRYMLYYALNIGFFYAVIWSLQWLMDRRKAATTILRLALVFSSYLGLKFFINYLTYAGRLSFSAQLKYLDTFMVTALYRSFSFFMPALFTAVAVHLSVYRQKAALAKAKLEADLAAARNAYLQQQLNPHLLFNSLNFIYSEVFRYSEDGARAVELLADILRYSIRETGADGRTDLRLEIEQVQNLVALHRLRFGKALALSVQLPDQPGDHQLIPLILLTLTENIFKHGHLQRPGLLAIHITPGGLLTYHCKNFKKNAPQSNNRPGIGLKHSRLRLDYAYPGAYTLAINETVDVFELTLTLQL